jgi:hypothetical protein
MSTGIHSGKSHVSGLPKKFLKLFVSISEYMVLKLRTKCEVSEELKYMLKGLVSGLVFSGQKCPVSGVMFTI